MKKLCVRLLLLVSLSSCAGSGQITKVELCREIPFADGAEAACATTVENTSRLVNAKDWAEMRPFMLMISAKFWTNIKLDWLKACRYAMSQGDQDACNVKVQTVDTIIRELDKIASKFFPIPQ